MIKKLWNKKNVFGFLAIGFMLVGVGLMEVERRMKYED